MEKFMEASWTTLILAASVLCFLYRYFSPDFGYWKRQGVPVVKTPISKIFTLKPSMEDDILRNRKYGRIYVSSYYGTQVLTITDPEILKYILVKDFSIFTNRKPYQLGLPFFDIMLVNSQNENWRRMRSVMAPTFTSGKIRKMVDNVMNAVDILKQKILLASENGKPVDLKWVCSNFAMNGLWSSIFGIGFDKLRNEKNSFVESIEKVSNVELKTLMFQLFVAFVPFVPSCFKTYLLKHTIYQTVIDSSNEMITERQTPSDNKPNVDLLQLMLNAKKGELKNTELDKQELNDEGTEDYVEKIGSTKTMTFDEIISQCLTFLVAGHQSVASTVTFMAFELARNKDVQEKLIREVDEAWENNEELNYDVVSVMPYMDAVLSETLRLYPPIPRTARTAAVDYTIPKTGIVIPKNFQVNVSIYAIHHDPEFFHEPEKFDPERFSPENKCKILPGTYMPFGIGRRNCIAMRFAVMEIKHCFAHLLRQVTLSPTTETPDHLDIGICHSTVKAKAEKITVKVEKRLSF